jgi:hypothetical protein
MPVGDTPRSAGVAAACARHLQAQRAGDRMHYARCYSGAEQTKSNLNLREQRGDAGADEEYDARAQQLAQERRPTRAHH